MSFREFRDNFNFITNTLIVLVFIFATISYADTNGVWNRAEDIRPGVFGSDEGFTSEYIFINPLTLTVDTYYKGVELDNRFLNENETAINSHKLEGYAWSNIPTLIDENNQSYRLNLDGDSILNVTHQDKAYVNELYVNNVKIEDVFQSKVISGDCGSGKYIQAINSDGTITCASDQTGGGGGSTCQNGQTTGNPCSGNYYRCVNGKWEKQSDNCR